MVEVTVQRWSNKFSYLLSIIGFVIGLGNFWLFPTTCYKYGGAVFLIPYTIFLLIIGVPIVYLELLLGQVFRKANLGVFKELAPWLQGTAYSVIIMNIIRQTYYNTVIAWALNLLFASFSPNLPWDDDLPALKQVLETARNNSTQSVAASIDLNQVHFITNVLGKSNSTGIHDLGGLQAALVPCLIIVFVTVYVIICDGATSIGTSVYLTAILPYVLLFVLLIKSATLPGAKEGLRNLFRPKFDSLAKLETWRHAAIQICYSLGPGAGVLVAYASYSDNENLNIKFYAIVVVLCNALTSVLCGIVLFCGLGYFVRETGVDFDTAIDYGYSVIFVIYPMIISKFKYGFLFSIAFFGMIFMIGLNSVYAEIEGMYAALADRFPCLNVNTARKKLLILLMCFFASLPSITIGGAYIVDFLLMYGIAPAVLIVIAIECVAATWIYGYSNLINRVREYSSVNNPGMVMEWCWKIVIPIITLALYISNFIDFNNKTNDTMLYGPAHITKNTKIGGEILSALTLLPIPAYAIFWILRKKFLERRDAAGGRSKLNLSFKCGIGSR